MRFVFFIPHLDSEGAARIQARIEAEIAELGKAFPCGLSIGYSVLDESDVDFERHFKIADEAMYSRKREKKLG